MSLPPSLDEIKEDGIQEIVKASEDPKETIKQLSEMHSQEMKRLKKKYWGRNRFCSCNADSIIDCECDKDKRKRYMKRVSRKINNELGLSGATILMLKQEYRV